MKMIECTGAFNASQQGRISREKYGTEQCCSSCLPLNVEMCGTKCDFSGINIQEYIMVFSVQKIRWLIFLP